MHNFQYREGELCCEDVPLARIAKEVGSPCYVYSHSALVRQFRAYDSAFQNIPHIVAFAMKANSNLAVLKLMASEGSGVDIVSGGELFRALKAGVPASKIVFAGVGKNAGEIRDALKAGILMFNVESSAELHAINDVAASMGHKARVALRINPDIDPKTHPYISTGLKKSKFGIGAERALEEFKVASSLKHIEVVGVHKHIGSQLTDVTPFVEALKKVLVLVQTLKEQGIEIRYINIGGGLGITYSDETPPQPKDLAVAHATMRSSNNPEGLGIEERRGADQHSCHADQRVKGCDQLGHRSHLDLARGNKADAAADQNSSQNFNHRLGVKKEN